jgi:hypothetical protein
VVGAIMVINVVLVAKLREATPAQGRVAAP